MNATYMLVEFLDSDMEYEYIITPSEIEALIQSLQTEKLRARWHY